jgi:putative restriction endonuclease
MADDPSSLTFTVAVEEEKLAAFKPLGEFEGYQVAEDLGESRRAYLTAQTKVRVHQRSFRERVLRAYHEQCAFCRLKHQELLDAAHIIADSDPEGEPVITNGIALCKLHHAAFDSHFLGITSGYVIQVRPDILVEPDGPMHQHGIKAMQGQRLVLPPHKVHWPDPKLLEKRYDLFRGGW